MKMLWRVTLLIKNEEIFLHFLFSVATLRYYAVAFASFLFVVGDFFGRTFFFLPSMMPCFTRKLCTVSESCAPCEMRVFTSSASTMNSLECGLYEPRTLRNLPVFAAFLWSVKMTRKCAWFLRPMRCNLIFNMAS